jgi:hypothetical protein
VAAGGRMAGSKKVQRVGRQKEHAILTGSPQGGVFSSRQRIVLALSFRQGGHKGGTGESSIILRRPGRARTHTYGCFQFSSTLELATMGRIGRVRAWAGQVWNRGGRVGKGGRGVHSEECTGVISGLWCSWTAAGTILPLPCFCVLILSSFLFSIFVCFLFLIYFN